MQSVAFQTRARTIDHLGREQIADTPTAVSELWKNAYDAYAHEVVLHIFDGPVPVAAVLDDGHGMSAGEFINKWLVVGTESKVSGTPTPEEDRNGLPERPRQGQKGIGRLSCAALGSLLLLLSKRRGEPFVAAMIDWRLFENPYLMLGDLRIPVMEFEDPDQLVCQLPELFDRLMGNLWGDKDDEERGERIQNAWRAFEGLEEKIYYERNELSQDPFISTKSLIENTVISTAFEERHFSKWSVWDGKSEQGTALFLSDITFDLKAQLPLTADDGPAKRARDGLFETLSNFSDPYADAQDQRNGYTGGAFACSVVAWNSDKRRDIVSPERQFDLAGLEACEHVVHGEIDDDGIFRGRIKAYGRWLEGTITIRPPGAVPKRADSHIGPFRIRAGSWTDRFDSSTLPKEVIEKLRWQADLYGGFMVHRDGLRVLPYGRESNDFFEIERRRSIHAGRHFWSNRRTFGRVAISRRHNPNLKDKAGREGFIDNRAAKAFRDIVENILEQTGSRFFGTESEPRKNIQPELEARNEAARAEQEQSKLRAKLRKTFRVDLNKKGPQLESYLGELKALSQKVSDATNVNDEATLLDLRSQLSDMSNRVVEFTLGEPPKNLTETLQQDYKAYRDRSRTANSLLAGMREQVSQAFEKIRLSDPHKVANSELARNASFLHHRIRRWVSEANGLLEAEKDRLRMLASDRNKAYHAALLQRVDDVAYGRADVNNVLQEMESEKLKQDEKNRSTFEPYIAALRSLQESIDLEGLAAFGERQVAELREELDRINALAQLGITVEIISHEMESLDTTVTRSLESMPESVQRTDEYRHAKAAHEALTERLRFLSPLKLSGPRSQEWITGRQIEAYVRKFFKGYFDEGGIKLEVTEKFSSIKFYDQPARIYPVFINLVNNSRYWVQQREGNERLIRLDAVDNSVIIADDGPGVPEEDWDSLFKLFFTRKRRGHGVGLYLCKANLAAAGHSIDYLRGDERRILPGANFIIEFQGAEHG